MKDKDYTKDLSDIRDFMSRSSQFISLSGLSGILAGVYAILGGIVAYGVLNDEALIFTPSNANYNLFIQLIPILFVVALLSIITAIILSKKRAKLNKEKLWSEPTKRMLLNFCIPLITGGIYILLNLSSRQYGLTAALMLIFYGLALLNASKYTVSTIKYLAYAQLLTGLVCAAIPEWGFWFWLFGFGVLHIFYGSLLYTSQKAERP